MSTRWICIGTLRAGGQIIHVNGWTRCAVSILWRGRTSWCQPWQFEEWEMLWWAVRRRLSLCRLRPLAYASVPPSTGEYQKLWVQVARLKTEVPPKSPG